jgi:phospholipase C
MLAYFTQYQKADKNSPLTKSGNTYLGLEQFYEDAANGTLPLISYIVGPAELSEHYPYLPSDGAWLQKKVVDAVTSSPLYKETALILSYDGKNLPLIGIETLANCFTEVGGYGDHVTPYTAPKDTPGEWIYDPYGMVGNTPVGPGTKLSMIQGPPLTVSRLSSPIRHHITMDPWRSRLHRARRSQQPEYVCRRMA